MPIFRTRERPRQPKWSAMQDFRDANPTKVKDNMIQELSDIERELIIRWILRDYRPIFGGTTISK